MILPHINLPISHRFTPINVTHISLRLKLVACSPRPDPSPKPPINRSPNQHTDTDDREDVVRITPCVVSSFGWYERHDCQEDICDEIEDDDWEIGVEG